MMQLLEEMKERGVDIRTLSPRVHCKAFKNNAGTLELTKALNMCPHTKHRNAIYHHFRSWVREGKITLFPIASEHQVADISIKLLLQNLFMCHRKKLMGSDRL
eukprot:11478308-Ditylum_brightwellii.AAC.1